jgi:hypothetical protein
MACPEQTIEQKCNMSDSTRAVLRFHRPAAYWGHSALLAVSAVLRDLLLRTVFRLVQGAGAHSPRARHTPRPTRRLAPAYRARIRKTTDLRPVPNLPRTNAPLVKTLRPGLPNSRLESARPTPGFPPDCRQLRHVRGPGRRWSGVPTNREKGLAGAVAVSVKSG